MNEELAERLNLDPRQVERTARATELYVRKVVNVPSDERSDASQDQILQSAALLTVAASYWLLLDPPHAFPLFADASELYASLGHSFAYVTTICGAGRRFPQMSPSHGEPGTEMEVEEAYHLLLGEAWNSALGVSRSDPELGDNLLTPLSDGLAWPTGRLRLPQRSHVAVLRDSIDLTDRWSRTEGVQGVNHTRLERDLRSFLIRVDEQVEAAISDNYHWRRLQSAILPVEPEAVATCAVGAASALATSGEVIIDRIDVPERAAVPLQLGTEIARTARQEGMQTAT